MNALITGGGGFLGRRIVDILLERGDGVRVLGRRRYTDIEQLGVECVTGDVRCFEDVLRTCAGCDTVFHTAALAGIWGQRKDFYEINVKGTANVIQACLGAKVSHLVYTSSPSVVFGETDIEGADEALPYPARYLAHYPASKAVAEKMVLDANGWEMVVETRRANPDGTFTPDSHVRRLRTCALRPHLIWGPRDPHLLPRLVAAARSGRLRRVGEGRNRVDITYIDNAALAHVQAAVALMATGAPAGKAYFIGDGDPVVLWDWINALLERLGVKPVTRSVSYATAYRLGAAMEGVYTVLPFLGEPRMTRFVAAQFAKSHWFSHARARADFGYEPVVDNPTGLARTVEWLRQSAGR
ncbi:MAG: 3-beta hydroxysteroid dehydrogenase [Lentisphaerae bacterium RIFOXYB12_FULL_65_16]|nr:MAG: 3-beta hydroxysteroid dehydrogenase [Lentisphaerae bacterium RIFOXYA12_64_32]OGV92300.1 MAG: 3-beta hydroxysteroid dehydrogenase [Lentisphaerae bacterium RIFOXYB12_FULL_65_16]